MKYEENEAMVAGLEEALAQEMRAKNRRLSRANLFNTSVRHRELFEKQLSVVFIYRITNKYVFLEFCCPLTKEQRSVLDTANYVPLLRSEKYMKVGTDMCGDINYAYTQIRFPLEGGGIDFIDAMECLHREMERVMKFNDICA